jgi:1-phosphofructokinase family hexose kinase
VAVIVSPNLTVDRTVRIARLQPGAVLRPRRAVVTAGSKGVNVARVLAKLAVPCSLIGFVPATDRSVTDRLFAREPFELVGVEVPGELRVATIYLEDDGRVTVLNEPGPEVDGTAWQALEDVVRLRLAAAPPTTILICSGSLPPGAPSNGYGRLAALARESGHTAVVDAARDVLASTLRFEPDLVVPNLAEAEAALGVAEREAVDESGPDVSERAARAARALVTAGARAAVVTAGAAGAACAAEGSTIVFPGIPVTVANPIGAGDSFVGGFAAAREAGCDLLAAVARGLGAATASCEQDLAGGIDPERARVLAGQIDAERHVLDVPARP